MKTLFLASLAVAAPLAAQAPAVHLIAAPDAQSKPIFGAVPAVRALPNGGVLVNDITKRQLTLLDPALSNAAIVADSVAGLPSSYGTRPGGLIAYAGDSTLFVDPAGLSMFVLDPAGKIARVASVPRSQDAAMIGNNVTGNPGYDGKGRIVYRGGLTMVRAAGAAPGPRGPGGMPPMPDFPDSAAVVRVDVASRKIDTLSYFKIPRIKMRMEQTERGFTATSEQNPMPIVDDFGVLADGSLAIVRGQDYHVDFVGADGAVTNGAKIPFDWQRLSDDDKVAVIDSAKKAFEAAAAAMQSGNPNAAAAMGAVAGGQRMVINMTGGAGDGGGGIAQRMMATGGGMPTGNIAFVSPSELPDYRPAFTAGSARGDLEGNLWVRTSASRPGTAGIIYDVINRRGELIDRVQLPASRTVVGFGKGGVVYMLARDTNGSWIERTHR